MPKKLAIAKIKEIKKLPYQDLIGMQAKIIGTNNLRPTNDMYGAGEDMHKCIGRIGTVRDIILDNDYMINENGEEVPDIEYVEGISMFNYTWAIEDVELIPPKEDIKPKVLKFNPKTLFEGLKKDGYKHKRTSNGVGNKRRSKDKQPKRNTNKTVVKRSSK